MNPIKVSATVARPQDEVFQYLADIANHVEFTDHFLRDWHLTRVDSFGRGAGARFHMRLPFNRFSWYDTTFVECERPYRIAAQGCGGKFNRIKTYATWTLSQAPGNCTRVEYSYETEPVYPSDRILEALGARYTIRRASKKALRRLCRVLEEGQAGGKQTKVAGM